ncbi:unnamed protein product [Caenorhabditis sp. 36 PRJEB53466]|nr:unnamed protein product [Caenorhabditis sp. 36 PRJEB53466]
MDAVVDYYSEYAVYWPFSSRPSSLKMQFQAALFLCCGTFLVTAHPPTSAKMHDAIGVLATEIDTAHLTNKPVLKMNKPLSDVAATTGERVVLTCEATSTPAAVFLWTFNGETVQGDHDLNMYEKVSNIGKPIVESGIVASTFTIPCASASDAGVYKCVAYNGHITTESTATVSVEGDDVPCKSTRKSAPTIVQWSDSRFEMQGNTATLLCRTNKPATITWDLDGELLRGHKDRHEVLHNGDLVIHDVHWEDMGTYVCIASNKHGEDRVETFLYPTAKKTL